MKKLFGVIVALAFGAFTYGQTSVVFSDAKEGYNKAAVKDFHFNLSGFTVDQINSSAGYYTSYFTVATSDVSGSTAVTISLVEDTEMARRVISRFFVSLEVEEISANGTKYAVIDFVDQYVMI